MKGLRGMALLPGGGGIGGAPSSSIGWARALYMLLGMVTVVAGGVTYIAFSYVKPLNLATPDGLNVAQMYCGSNIGNNIAVGLPLGLNTNGNLIGAPSQLTVGCIPVARTGDTLSSGSLADDGAGGITGAKQITLTEKAAPAVAPAGTASLYMDSTSKTLMASVNGGAYAELGGGGLEGLTLNKLLKAGSATTAVDSSISDSGTLITVANPLTLKGMLTATDTAGTGAGLVQSVAGQALTVVPLAPIAPTDAATAGGVATYAAANASASVAGTAGAAAGGQLNLTAGNAAQRTSGAANGGDVVITVGTAVGAGTTGAVDCKVSGGASGSAAIKAVGTNLTALNASNVSSGALPLANLTDGATAGIPLVAGGAGDPSYTALALGQATAISGTLPITNGGTGLTATTAYAPLFGGTTTTGALQTGAVGTAGQVLTSNGAGALATFQAAAGGANLSTSVELWEEFLSGLNTSNSTGPLRLQSYGSGGSTIALAGEASSPGILMVRTGTGGNDYGACSSASTGISFGGGVYTFEARARIPALSDGTDTFTTRLGFGDANFIDPVDGVFLRYTHGENSGHWVLAARSNDTETVANAATGPTANTWVRLRIVVAANGSSAEAFADGASLGTVASNVPTGVGRETGLVTSIVKSAGTTVRSIEADYMYLKFVPTTER